MSPIDGPLPSPEFDRYAREYDVQHSAALSHSGEGPEYFASYKAEIVRRVLGDSYPRPILDFGCGIGNLVRLLGGIFSNVSGYDPSGESVRIASERAPGVRFETRSSDLPRDYYGAVIIANVLHHVPPLERAALLQMAVNLLESGGRLLIFEHNPWNPLTQHVVRTCPLDVNAVLLPPSEVTQRLRDAGLYGIRREYIVFFPRFLRALRPLERRLAWFPLGAQVFAHASRP